MEKANKEGDSLAVSSCLSVFFFLSLILLGFRSLSLQTFRNTQYGSRADR